jgi:hypothetical protein
MRSGFRLLNLGVLVTRSGTVVPMSTDEPRMRPPDGGSVLSEVSNAMARVYKDYFGRGPTAARAHWFGENLLTVLLEDTLAHRPERNLVRMGEHPNLRDMRTFFQYATVREFCEPVDRSPAARSGRSCDTDVDGLSIEAFVLHPPR